MQLLKTITSPIFIVIVIFASGMLLLILKKKESLARFFLGLSFITLCLLGFRPFSNYLLWGLERKYPPLTNFNDLHDIHYIVVLTDWDSDNPTVPYTSNIGYRSAFRILETNRIYMNLSRCKIILSGGPVSAKLTTKLMVLLGIQKENIIIDDKAENTWESAINVKKILSGQPFILVTSAIHLPRAMNSFVRHGLKPIPAPADFSYGYYQDFTIPLGKPLAYYIPNVNSFLNSHSALYEYLGMFWYSIKSMVKDS
ncbi:MAG: ElyC/SanA/YdcF family protein [Nitrospirota bacterium]